MYKNKAFLFFVGVATMQLMFFNNCSSNLDYSSLEQNAKIEDPPIEELKSIQVMYSYSSDLSEAKPLDTGSILEPTTVYIFLENHEQISSESPVLQVCCENPASASSSLYIYTVQPPHVVVVDLAPFVGFNNNLFDLTYLDAETNEAKKVNIMFTVKDLEANNQPIAVEDLAKTESNQSVNINVLANDYDLDEDLISVTSTSEVNGSLTLNENGTVTYTPPTNFVGMITFTYGITDSNGGVNEGNVTVNIIDTIVPTVTITSPTNGQVLESVANIEAAASDNLEVSKVVFYINNEIISVDTTSPYSTTLNTLDHSDGYKNISAVAYDVTGNSSTKSTVTVKIENYPPDLVKPTVSITNPGNNSVLPPKTEVIIEANAYDDVKLAKVDFRINGILICSDTTAPYSCNYSIPGARSKSYLVEANAYDTSGNVATDAISFYSSN